MLGVVKREVERHVVLVDVHIDQADDVLMCAFLEQHDLSDRRRGQALALLRLLELLNSSTVAPFRPVLILRQVHQAVRSLPDLSYHVVLIQPFRLRRGLPPPSPRLVGLLLLLLLVVLAVLVLGALPLRRARVRAVLLGEGGGCACSVLRRALTPRSVPGPGTLPLRRVVPGLAALLTLPLALTPLPRIPTPLALPPMASPLHDQAGVITRGLLRGSPGQTLTRHADAALTDETLPPRSKLAQGKERRKTGNQSWASVCGLMRRCRPQLTACAGAPADETWGLSSRAGEAKKEDWESLLAISPGWESVQGISSRKAEMQA